jgi:hypothetical protein
MELRKDLRPSWPLACVGGREIATLASVVNQFTTAKGDLPIGAAIVCALGVVLIVVMS